MNKMIVRLFASMIPVHHSFAGTGKRPVSDNKVVDAKDQPLTVEERREVRGAVCRGRRLGTTFWP